LDVDLEDRLLYGLTPTRLAYVVLALLGGFALWSSQWAPTPVRGFASTAVIAVGAAVAWGRWRGRAIDAWFGDLALFVINTHRLAWTGHWPSRRVRNPIACETPRQSVGVLEIVVTGRNPRAGASTIAAELAVWLAVDPPSEKFLLVRKAPPDYEHKPSPTAVLLSVAAVDGGRVCYLDRGAGPFVAAVIPEDDCVRKATALGQAAVVAFPDAPASRALKKLAEVIVAGDP
jgi:hypothetical protein